MNKLKIILLVTIVFLSCRNENDTTKMQFLTDKIPNNIPFEFKQDVVPENKLIHKGIFSPNLKEYYYTISDTNFKKFDVFVIKKDNGNWTEPKKVFFNSKYNEHGMSFSPDGNSIYFSSTRPTNVKGTLETWHIWKSDNVNGEWKEPVFVDIPNLRDKLVSHPTITNSGTLYFHTSNIDYSEMDIYHSKKVNGKFENAEKTSISMNSKTGKCTPYVSPNEDYLIFASIGNQLDLMISFSDGRGGWINTKKLNNKINNIGQGNPYVTPDNKFLFYTTGEHLEKNWRVNWVDIESELKNN
ncbi:TolB family protein [Aureibaculum luteum]|uniref:TolB family protein n=1 Tax=Aureibaculum luteum TaxID=1548456 RepID=UPI001300AE5C|nr:PD40 domain-containing protein [Aureibaculum luteum]